MEDRQTPELYVEMWSEDAAVYERDRVPVLASAPGVQRVWWASNANRNRADLPRRLDECAALGLAEVTPEFRPDGTGFHFRRTPRPAQGSLTGRPTIGLLLVLISAREPDEAQELRDWADFVHIRHIAEAAIPGYGMITPYERVPSDAAGPRYMHLYEFHDGEPEEVFQSLTPLMAARLGSAGTPSFDAWARHAALRIEYVNTFRVLGSTPPVA